MPSVDRLKPIDRDKLKELENELNVTREELANTRNQLRILTRDLDTAQCAIREYEAQQDSHMQEKNKFSFNCQDWLLELRSIEEPLLGFCTRAESVYKREMDSMKAVVADMSERHGSFSKEMDQLLLFCEDLNETIAKIHDEQKQGLERMHQIEQAQKQLQHASEASPAVHNGQGCDLRSEVATIRLEKAWCQAQQKQMAANVDGLQERVSLADAYAETLEQYVVQMNQQLVRRSTIVKELQGENERLKTAKLQMEDVLSDSNQKIQELSADNERLHEEQRSDQVELQKLRLARKKCDLVLNGESETKTVGEETLHDDDVEEG
eukprot:Clim_evm8s56 gene=Clim_evmTU8s56